MSLKRALIHLLTPAWRTRRLLPPEALRRIEEAIAASERAHGGEIRFAVEAALDPGELLRGKTARERAIEVFSQLRVWDTENNNGVLIYLLIADHDVEIVADRGINARVGAAAWERICQEMESSFRAGRFEEGVMKGIAAVGEQLRRHYPEPDRGELPDAPVVL